MQTSRLYSASVGDLHIGLGEAGVASQPEVTLALGPTLPFECVPTGSLLQL